MKTSRLEAFSDGVMAIIITIMVLEFETPDSPELAALASLLPSILSYIISFVFIGIYWNNHHHLLHAAEKISGSTLWLNLNLLFWLSLIPFATAWMDEQHFSSVPVALYGFILFMCALSYFLIRNEISRHQSSNSILRRDDGSNRKMFLSLALQFLGIILSLSYSLIAVLLYVLSALLWVVPEEKIEKSFK
ncbi:MAG: TMEM175 family protein [Candidatus Thiodiazotropha endolucinida]